MPTGFQSINDWGTVQFDENYSAVGLRAAPVITVAGYPNKTYYDVYGVSPMLFLGNTNGIGVVVLSRVYIGTNLWRFTLRANSQADVKLYIFDKGPPAASNSGMQVFNASGELTYDAAYMVLTLKDVFQVTGTGPNSFSIPQDGRSYAAAMSFSRMWVEKRPITHSPWDLYQEAMWVSGTSIYIDDIKVGSVGGEDPGSNRPKSTRGPPQVLLADVTYM
jgi:hypothetical protein